MRFFAQTDCFFGAHRYEDFHSAAGASFAGNGMVLVDSAVADSSTVATTLERLVPGETLPLRAVAVPVEPTYDQLDMIAQEVRHIAPSYLIAVGGGSVMDLAKGVSVLLTNPGEARDYRGMGKVKVPAAPLLAVPTTAGTGSEVTWTASFIDDQTRVKLGINGPNVFPRAAILEPKLLVGCPRRVAVSAGLDALVHAVEAVSSPMASEPATALARRAVQLLVQHLDRAVLEDTLQDWEAVQLAAYLAGLAMLNSSGGVASGVSYPIGTEFHVPHGFAGGVLLPRVVEWNESQGYTGYSALLGGGQSGFSDALWDLFRRLEAPLDFEEWGIKGFAAAERLFQVTMAQREASLAFNPTPFGPDELKVLLDEVCGVR